MDTQNRIVNIVRRVAGKPVDFAPEDSLFESGLLDSFSLTDLVSELESEFSIQIPIPISTRVNSIPSSAFAPTCKAVLETWPICVPLGPTCHPR